MKTSLIPLLLVGAALSVIPLRMAAADDEATSGQAAAGAQGQRFEKFKAAMEQLNLTDAQKEQIKQIRATVTDRKERFKQVMNVLTPDQKAKLQELIKEHRNGPQAGAATASAPSAN